MQQIQPAVEIPNTFRGRPVSNRGVHLQPVGLWGVFMDSADTWIERLLDMGVSWVIALTDSDSFKKSGAARELLDAGIIPIVRDNPSNLPRSFTNMDAVAELADLYAEFGAPLFYAYLNECGNDREWQGKVVPRDWWEIWTRRWREAAPLITERGAIICLPDGPTWDQSPFPDCSRGIEHLFEDGWVAYKYHGYALNRPLDWPYDKAQRFGVPMTEEEYCAALDDYYDEPYWQDPPLTVLNAERERLADPDLTALQDPTCWMGWQLVEFWMGRDLGFLIPMFMGEGGVTPKARAGSGPDNELRYTLPTPKVVAGRTLEMYNWNDSPDIPAPHHMFALCPWLVADRELGGPGGWEDDAWFGGSWSDKYGYEKPVVQVLKDNPPHPTLNLDAAIRELELASEGGERMLDFLGV